MPIFIQWTQNHKTTYIHVYVIFIMLISILLDDICKLPLPEISKCYDEL